MSIPFNHKDDIQCYLIALNMRFFSKLQEKKYIFDLGNFENLDFNLNFELTFKNSIKRLYTDIHQLYKDGQKHFLFSYITIGHIFPIFVNLDKKFFVIFESGDKHVETGDIMVNIIRFLDFLEIEDTDKYHVHIALTGVQKNNYFCGSFTFMFSYLLSTDPKKDVYISDPKKMINFYKKNVTFKNLYQKFYPFFYKNIILKHEEEDFKKNYEKIKSFNDNKIIINKDSKIFLSRPDIIIPKFISSPGGICNVEISDLDLFTVVDCLERNGYNPWSFNLQTFPLEEDLTGSCYKNTTNTILYDSKDSTILYTIFGNSLFYIQKSDLMKLQKIDRYEYTVQGPLSILEWKPLSSKKETNSCEK